MNYLIAVLADRIQAEAAYSELERQDLPMPQVSILGSGYKTADEFGFIDPKIPARKQAKLMAFWLVPFGFLGGWLFNLSTQSTRSGSRGNRQPSVRRAAGSHGRRNGQFFCRWWCRSEHR